MMGRSPQSARLATLFRDDASLLESMEWLRELRLMIADGNPHAQKLLEETFALLNDGLLPDRTVKVVRYDAEGLWVRATDGAELPVGDLSDGYRAVIALVLDIDETVLSNFEQLDQTDYCFDRNAWNAWVETGKPKPPQLMSVSSGA